MNGRDIQRVRALRRKQTPPESIVWIALRNRKLCGFKFRRQHPIGPYVADFYCDEARLVVEIDGRQHDLEHDRKRDAWMASEGYETLRITASLVSRDPDAVKRTILHVVRQRTGKQYGELRDQSK